MSLLDKPLDFHIEANRTAAIERLRRNFVETAAPDGQCWMLPDGAILAVREHRDAFRLFRGADYQDIFSIGCIRLVVDPMYGASLGVDLSAPPTEAQIGTLRRLVADLRPEVLHLDWTPARWEGRAFVAVAPRRSASWTIGLSRPSEGTYGGGRTFVRYPRRATGDALINWIRQQASIVVKEGGLGGLDDAGAVVFHALKQRFPVVAPDDYFAGYGWLAPDGALFVTGSHVAAVRIAGRALNLAVPLPGDYSVLLTRGYVRLAAVRTATDAGAERELDIELPYRQPSDAQLRRLRRLADEQRPPGMTVDWAWRWDGQGTAPKPVSAYWGPLSWRRPVGRRPSGTALVAWIERTAEQALRKSS